MTFGGAVGSAVGRMGRRVLYGTPGLRGLAARLRPRACVLMYHRVAAVETDPYGQAVHPARFREHLAALREHHDVLSLEDLVRGFHERDYPDGAVAVTFDDGYADTLDTACPAAAALDVPVHVFVTTGPIEAGAPVFWWDELAALAPPGSEGYGVLHDELRRLPSAARDARIDELRAGRPPAARDQAGRPLTVAELAELARLPSVGIGAHSVTHPALASRPADEQAAELVDARARLQQLTGLDIGLVSYPFGKEPDVGPETRRLAAEAGYDAAFMTVPRALVPSSDPFGLPRLAVHDWPAERLLGRIAEVLGPTPG